LLFTTGITIGEALGLRGTDFSIERHRVFLHEEGGRQLKRECRARDLGIPEALIPLLAERLDELSNPFELAFPVKYPAARKAWVSICADAEILEATIHDARHTFAVEAVKSGIPEARLQRLLGHSHPGTTRRYAMHSPEAFLDADAERIAKNLNLPTDSPTPLVRLA
jgi:integrase